MKSPFEKKSLHHLFGRAVLLVYDNQSRVNIDNGLNAKSRR